MHARSHSFGNPKIKNFLLLILLFLFANKPRRSEDAELKLILKNFFSFFPHYDESIMFDLNVSVSRNLEHRKRIFTLGKSSTRKGRRHNCEKCIEKHNYFILPADEDFFSESSGNNKSFTFSLASFRD